MHELWWSSSYEPHLLSLVFAYAPVTMLTVIAYAIVMRGEVVLRTWFLVHSLCLLPYAVTLTLSPSVVSADAATELFRIAVATVPMAAACGAAFQLKLLGKSRKWKVVIWFMLANGFAWMALGVGTDLVVTGVRWLPAGLWFANPGRWAPGTLLSTTFASWVGFVPLALTCLRLGPTDERRQLRQTLLANCMTYAGLIDVSLGYGHGVFPIGWILIGTGSLLTVRALIVEDLLRVRAVDRTAPALVLHAAAGMLLGWVVLTLLGPQTPWWASAMVLCMSYASVRVIFAVIGLVNLGMRGNEDPLDRLVGQLVTRSRGMRSATEIAQLATDIIELGIGVRPQILIASADDWGWSTAAGVRLADDASPDPLVGGWLIEQRRTVFADELELDVPVDLQPMITAMFKTHAARALVTVTNHDELLALIAMPTAGRRVRGRGLWFLERAGSRLGEALAHARLAQRAAAHAELAREVELAATVQAELLPPTAPQRFGDVALVGSWLPASRCAGDFWSVHPLGDGRVLVAIGDVTGHGVAAAMITAAASGAVAAWVRRDGPRLALDGLMSALDTVVRRVGGGELVMTCAAAILDPAANEVAFVSCGHAAPYLCRVKAEPAVNDSLTGSAVELHALVARGNPLGGAQPARAKVGKRALAAGDLLVWYTDGVIEANDPAGEPFGDRRLQRLLRKLDREHLTPGEIHAVVAASVAAHRAGRPLGDDETLVVAQIGAQIGAAA